MKKEIGLTILSLGMMTGVGQAEEAGLLSGEILERAYQAHIGFDGLSGSRFESKVLHPLGDHLFLSTDQHAPYPQQVGSFNLPLDALSAGVGGQYTLMPLLDGISLDLFGELSYLNRYDAWFDTERWHGYGLGGGLRMGIQQALSLEFGVLQNALDNTRNNLTSELLSYSFGALYQLTPNLGLTASFMAGEYERDLRGQEISEWRIGARLGF